MTSRPASTTSAPRPSGCEREGDFGNASRVRYGEIPALEKELEAAQQAETAISSADLMVKERVGADDIAEVISAWTGIPAGRLLQGETEKLLSMESIIGARLIGQAEAVRAVSDAVRRSRAGIADPDRPTGSFLFLGPTGVGKTELAKSLADFLFDDERAMVRIDMSEYSERHAVARLIGAPPGYVGYEEGGQLTEAVRRRPYSVVLLDEVEKAHPETFDILLQVLDDGRLTDGQGRTVDFRNVILVMTSNLGSQYLIDPVLDPHAKREAVMAAVRTAFKPEFLNRLDEVVVFDALSTDELSRIVDLQVQGALDAPARPPDHARGDDRGEGVAGRAGVRPGLRRPAAAPPRAARDRGPARDVPPLRRGPRRRHGDRRPRRGGPPPALTRPDGIRAGGYCCRHASTPRPASPSSALAAVADPRRGAPATSPRPDAAPPTEQPRRRQDGLRHREDRAARPHQP